MVREDSVALKGGGSANFFGKICLLALRIRPILEIATQKSSEQFYENGLSCRCILRTKSLHPEVIVVLCHWKLGVGFSYLLLRCLVHQNGRERTSSKLVGGHIPPCKWRPPKRPLSKFVLKLLRESSTIAAKPLRDISGYPARPLSTSKCP